MTNLNDGEVFEMQGSGKKPYILKNTSGVYSCSCPAWRNQSLPIDKRTCKHLRKLRGDAAEEVRVSTTLAPVATPKAGVTPPPLLLAHVWDGELDPTGWWMSEKLDGVRAFWQDGRFITRQGNTYMAPDWFVKGLPKATLDGELWIGRKQFQKTISVVRQQDAGDLWKAVRFMVFDAPSKLPFEERQAKLSTYTLKCPYAGVHPQEKVKSLEHVKEALSKVEALGGEGLMLREPGSLYEVGRSMTLLKVKSFSDDEATVIGYQKGKGRHKGRTGALMVRLDNGKEFEIGGGLSDAEREDPPALNSTVTFRYQGLTDGGIPRFPVYVGVRED